ncbi:hypothetical protein ACHHYP_16944 [Achlya hypogyna]|uniref:CS domain-containing protein n=1 Tax=Achlya hypogyna TaxID=1202772 RepID=A0A1V9ZE91_ACHHY|nr:hypothetical protein ACHHYP_16944 [Achlya hypogyna]
MPLTPQYEWSQDEASISLRVPLKGTSRKEVDFYVADLVIKINFKPYVLILDLTATIDPASTMIKLIDGAIDLTVKKESPGAWKELTFHGAKSDVLARRKASMDRKTEMEQQWFEKRKELKYATEKKTLRDQMALEEHERQRLDDLKADEKQREEEAMYQTFKQLQCPAAPKHVAEKRPMMEKRALEPILEAQMDGTFDVSHDAVDEDNQWSDTESEDDTVSPAICPELAAPLAGGGEDDGNIVYIPAPRDSLQSKISFTPRVFPTPSRESTAADEEDWLVKNRKHLKSHKGLNAQYAQDISETDPTWLKAKADDFYHHRDFTSARNAYTEALSVDPSLTTCLSNRAACHLHLGSFQLCADDCTAALAQLPDTGASPMDPCGSHRLKVRVLVRRGTAYSQLGLYSQAKADYGVALTMHPENEALQYDFAKITRLDECAREKVKADSAFASRDLAGAVELYGAALAIDPTFVAYDLGPVGSLQTVPPDAHGSIITLSSVPPPGSTKRREWVLKTLIRRGTAHASIHAYAAAKADFADGLTLDPTNDKLAQDLQCVRELAAAPEASAE